MDGKIAVLRHPLAIFQIKYKIHHNIATSVDGMHKKSCYLSISYYCNSSNIYNTICMHYYDCCSVNANIIPYDICMCTIYKSSNK